MSLHQTKKTMHTVRRPVVVYDIAMLPLLLGLAMSSAAGERKSLACSLHPHYCQTAILEGVGFTTSYTPEEPRDDTYTYSRVIPSHHPNSRLALVQ